MELELQKEPEVLEGPQGGRLLTRKRIFLRRPIFRHCSSPEFLDTSYLAAPASETRQHSVVYFAKYFLILAAFWSVFTATAFGQALEVAEAAKLVLANPGAEDEFGTSVALSRDTLAVGARGHGGSGSVFIFERDEGGAGRWGQVLRVVATDAADGDRFGQAVALEGDILAVGAPGDDDLNPSAAPGATMLEASGSVYLFERDVGGPNQWGQVAKLVASNGDIFENFGFTLALSGNRLAVAAWSEDEAVGPTQGGGSGRFGIDSGFAYIFDRNPVDGLWLETIYIDFPRTPVTTAAAFFDNFAKTIAIDGDTLVVGASEEDANDADQGTVYVFERNSGGPNQWGEAARLRAGDGTTFDRFGISVAMSGDTIVVGATGDDDAGSGAGTAFVFDRQNGQWVETAKLIASDGSDRARFGAVVSINGDTIIVGAPEEDEKGTDAGAVYIFQTDSGAAGQWGQVAKLTAGDAAEGDQFGATLAVGEEFAISGAFRKDVLGESSGSAYLFQLGGEPSSEYMDVFGGGEDLGGGWHFSDRYGFYNVNFMPWIFHLQHEWMFLTAKSVADSVFLYDLSSQGWFFTGATQYPNLFSFARSTWVFYFEDTAGPRDFVDLGTSEFFSLD